MLGKLLLVGTGIGGEKGISLAGLEALQGCGRVFAESYTNLTPEGTLGRLEKLCGKKIVLLSREQVEGEKELLASAKECATALAVSGDPMIATTHASLIVAAEKQGIEVEIIHGASAITAAIGESGLQAYKFGKMVTLAYWRKNYRPMTAYDVISDNLSRGMHTLLLLDIDEKLGPMKPGVAGETLLEMEKEGGKGIFSPSVKVVMLKGIGWRGCVKKHCGIADLSKYDGNDGPAVLIVPAKLHFLEEEYLGTLV